MYNAINILQSVFDLLLTTIMVHSRDVEGLGVTHKMQSPISQPYVSQTMIR